MTGTIDDVRTKAAELAKRGLARHVVAATFLGVNLVTPKGVVAHTETDSVQAPGEARRVRAAARTRADADGAAAGRARDQDEERASATR